MPAPNVISLSGMGWSSAVSQITTHCDETDPVASRLVQY